MATVIPQIIKDCIVAKPGGTGNTKITRDDANMGVAVKLALDQTARNYAAFGSVVVEKTSSHTDKIFGILGDYHRDNEVSIIRKGRIYVSTTTAWSSEGSQAAASIRPLGDAPDNYGKVSAVSLPPTINPIPGQILGGGSAEITNADGENINFRYLIVDLNLPVDPAKPPVVTLTAEIDSTATSLVGTVQGYFLPEGKILMGTERIEYGSKIPGLPPNLILTTGISATDTSLTGTAIGTFAASGKIAIGSEVASYTSVGGTPPVVTLSGLTRGIDGTTAIAHGAASVALMLDAEIPYTFSSLTRGADSTSAQTHAVATTGVQVYD